MQIDLTGDGGFTYAVYCHTPVPGDPGRKVVRQAGDLLSEPLRFLACQDGFNRGEIVRVGRPA